MLETWSESAKEILATLDKNWKLRLLYFMPEMVNFAGGQSRVHMIFLWTMIQFAGEPGTTSPPWYWRRLFARGRLIETTIYRAFVSGEGMTDRSVDEFQGFPEKRVIFSTPERRFSLSRLVAATTTD